MDFSFDLTGYAEALLKQNITAPTDIQKRVIPLILDGRDVIARSATGTGKTLAYLLPLFMKTDPSLRAVQAVIMAPTYELCAQVYRQAAALSENAGTGITSALIIGGASAARQIEALKQKPRIIIGSPGRILELIKIKKLSVHHVRSIVLDEGDRLLDGANAEAVTGVIKSALRDRQLLLFSATVTKKTAEAARVFMKEPAVLDLRGNVVPGGIYHGAFVCERRDKIKVLRGLIHTAGVDKALVFAGRQGDVDIASSRLAYHGVPCAAIYGEADGNSRRTALDAFIRGRVKVLTASDVAARGLDVAGITHVISLDVPDAPGGYAHRAGRCGRMGNTGFSYSIVTENEYARLKGFSAALNIQIPRKELSYGKVVDAHVPSINRQNAQNLGGALPISTG